MFTTSQFNTKICECGIPLNFDLIRPLREKLAELTTVQVNNFLVTFVTRSQHSIKVGDTIEIVSGGNLSSVYVGKHSVTAITTGTNNNINSFSFSLRVPDVIASDVTAYAYSIPNIDNSGRYIIQFSKELSVPDNAEVDISPASYEIQGSSNFSPVTTVKVKSVYTTSSKVIIKLSILNIFGKVLYTEYKQIVCSRFLDKPCEIVSTKPVVPSFIYLNRKNNWTYKYNGFLIAQFIPDRSKSYQNISLRLNRPSDAILPSNTNFDRLVLTIDPLLAQEKNVTRDQIKTAILDNPVSSSLQKNILVDDKLDIIIIQSSGLTLDQLKKIVILEQVSNNTTTKILVENIGSVSTYIPEPHPIPSIMFLTWSNNQQKNYFFGQFLFDYSIFNNQDMIMYFPESISEDEEVYNEINYRISPFVTTENLGYYDYSS